MILSKPEILAEIQKGNLKITPFEKANVGECSVDLRLGNEFRVFSKQKPLKITEEPFLWQKQTKKLVLKKNQTITLKPNQLLLGITLEKIKMPKHLCGFIEGRSRFARMGLMVHVSSGLIQPGVENKQVLEIVNLSPSEVTLTPGLRICQVVFEQLTSEQRNTSIFSRQTNI